VRPLSTVACAAANEIQNPRTAVEHLLANARGLPLDVVGLAGEPALGAHLETSRVGYRHHGVYIGNGRVVHYAGLGHRWQAGPIEEVPLSSFAVGHAIRVISHPGCTYSPQEVVERARSRVGERNYRLLTNNCEHFSNWCVSGLSRSTQTERSLGLALARVGPLVSFLLLTLAGLAREVISGSRLRLQGLLPPKGTRIAVAPPESAVSCLVRMTST
jgi:Lecithin retinol acyltransferase